MSTAVVVTVRGHSDDIVIVDGGGFCDEFYPTTGPEEKSYLVFSDGTVLEARYDGLWRFVRLMEGAATYSKVEGRVEPDDGTDTVTLSVDLRWVALTEQFTRRSDPDA